MSLNFLSMKLTLALFLLTLFQLISPGKDTPKNDQVCISSEEKKLYRIMMEYRKRMKLKTIPLSAKLTQVAQAHAHDLADHYRFNGDSVCNPHSWSTKGKWTPC